VLLRWIEDEHAADHRYPARRDTLSEVFWAGLHGLVTSPAAAVYEGVTTQPVSSVWSTHSVARRAEPVGESRQVGALALDSASGSRHVDLLVLWFGSWSAVTTSFAA
jgi:hypothetical protein